jgi:hypothetical protein
MTTLKRYTFVPILSGGRELPSVVVDAATAREANDKVWATLTDEQKDACEYLDWVDTEIILDKPTQSVRQFIHEQ